MIRYLLGFVIVFCAVIYGYGYFISRDSTPSPLVTATTLFSSPVGSAGDSQNIPSPQESRVVKIDSSVQNSPVNAPANSSAGGSGRPLVSNSTTTSPVGSQRGVIMATKGPSTQRTASAVKVSDPSKPTKSDKVDNSLRGGDSTSGDCEDNKPVVKLKNISLVVEDPSVGTRDPEKLIPVEPVELKAKPKPVAVVNMQSSGVKLRPQSDLTKGGSPLLDVELAKTGASLPSLASASDNETSNTVSADSSEISPKPNLANSQSNVETSNFVDQKPLLVDASAIKRTTPEGLTYSPFAPPPPGTLPSTLLGAEPVDRLGVQGQNPPLFGAGSLGVGNQGTGGTGGVGNIGGVGSQGPLTPATSLPAQTSGVPVARATLPDQVGAGQPQLPQQPQQNQPPSANSFFLSDSEAQAILDIAGSAGDSASPNNTVVGDTW